MPAPIPDSAPRGVWRYLDPWGVALGALLLAAMAADRWIW